MADKKKLPVKKASSKKTGSKAVAKRASSEVEKADPTQGHEEREIISSSIMELMNVRHSFHFGPLPSPENFANYNKGVPDAAERILSMAEHSQRSRSKRSFLIPILIFMAAIIYLIALVVVALYTPSLYVFPAGVAGLSVIVVMTLHHFRGGNKE